YGPLSDGARLSHAADARARRHRVRRAAARASVERRARGADRARGRGAADVRGTRTASRRGDRAGPRARRLGHMRPLHGCDVRLPGRRARGRSRVPRMHAGRRAARPRARPDAAARCARRRRPRAHRGSRARSLRARACRVFRKGALRVPRARAARAEPHPAHRRGAAEGERRAAARGRARPLRRGVRVAMSKAAGASKERSADAMAVLAERLCPWLREPLARLDAARRGGRLGHAWLIKGPAGVGKLNLAYVFAQRLLDGASDPSEPPPLAPADAVEAMSARRAPADHHPDLHRVFPEADKRTIGIEQIRELSQALAMKAFRGGAKAAVIEPAEAMTPAAANALLKTLEEPAEQTYLFLITHQPERLLPTIRSRCQGLAVAAPGPSEVLR